LSSSRIKVGAPGASNARVGGFGRLAHKPVDTSHVPRVRSKTVLREFIFRRIMAWVFEEAYFI
jgi:hypothetical protein